MPENWKLNKHRLGSRLRAFRLSNNQTVRAVEARLVKELAKSEYEKNALWNDLRKLVDPEEGGKLTALESSKDVKNMIELPDIQPLAKAYNVPPLMFDTLASEAVDKYYLVQNIPIYDNDKDFIRIDSKGRSVYGEGTKYWIPKKTLTNMENVDIFYFELEAQSCPQLETRKDSKFEKQVPHSESHFHPGDELILVEEGKIELRLEDMGLRIHLEAGEFIHYNAELRHSAYNCSEKPARAFIIRMHQLVSGSRNEFIKDLFRKNPPDKITNRNILEMRASTWTDKVREQMDDPKEVMDRLAFGRFLRLLCYEDFQGKGNKLSLKKLENLAQKTYKYKEFNYSKLDRIHHGETQVKKEDLPKLANIYDINKMLFSDYLFPAFRDAVAVHSAKDMEEIWPKEESKNGIYRIPKRRLAHSDMTIALVELKPEDKTPYNRHPGYELIKPIEGNIQVEIENEESIGIGVNQYGCFQSNKKHRVYNAYPETARFWAFRFLE